MDTQRETSYVGWGERRRTLLPERAMAMSKLSTKKPVKNLKFQTARAHFCPITWEEDGEQYIGLASGMVVQHFMGWRYG